MKFKGSRLLGFPEYLLYKNVMKRKQDVPTWRWDRPKGT